MWSLSLTASACGERRAESAAVVIRTDSAGVEIATSFGADRPLGWTLRPLFTLGGEAQGPGSFTSVSVDWVGADERGRIYVLDHHAFRVVVFGPDGAHLRTMGKEGAGPGELRLPATMAVSRRGVVSVLDFGKGSLVEFGPDGAVLPEVRFSHRTEQGVRRAFARHDGRYVVAKRMIGERSRSIEIWTWEETPAPDTVVLVRQVLGTPTHADFGCVVMALFPFFTPVLQWDSSSDLVAVVASAAFEIDLYRLDGARVRSIRRPVPPATATHELALAEAGQGWRMSSGVSECEASGEEIVRARGFADRVPAIASVLFSPSGEIWVERYRPGARAERTSGLIDVFGADGAYRGTLPEGTPFPLLFLPDDRIAISQRDAVNVERLLVMRLLRQY